MKKITGVIVVVSLCLTMLLGCSKSNTSNLNSSSITPTDKNETPTPTAQVLKEYLNTDSSKSDAYNAAIKAFNEFINGKISAVNNIDKYKSKTISVNDSMRADSKPGIDSFALFDVNGDGIPELNTRANNFYDVYSYQDNQMVFWYEVGGETPDIYPLENGAIFMQFTTTGTSYIYTTFALDGTTTTISFFDGEDPQTPLYQFQNKDVSKNEFDALTKQYIDLSKKPASVKWYNFE